MPEAYVVGHITVKDAEKWASYRSAVPQTLSPWNAQLVFRARQAAALAGELAHADLVVIRFPSLEAINNWYASPAYRALIPLREQAAEVVLLSYEAA